MSIPGSPFPEVPPADETTPVPIPNVSGASGPVMRYRSADDMQSLEPKDRQLSTIAQLFRLPESQMSLIEFVKIINQSIGLFEEQQEYAEFVDNLMNKKFHSSLAQSAKSLRKYRSQLISHLSRWVDVEEQVGQLLREINQEIEKYNFDLAGDKVEVENMNRAIKGYNDPKSSDYGNKELLQEAVDRYQRYIDGEGRNGALATFNTLIEQYNSRAEALNQTIAELNVEREAFNIIPIEDLPLLSTVNLLPKGPSLPLGDPGSVSSLDASLQSFALIEGRLKPRPRIFLRKLYDPVHNATIGYMDNLSYLFSMKDEYDDYDLFMRKALSTVFLDMIMVKFAYIYVDLVGGEGNSDSALRTGISWRTLDRLLAKTALRAATMETKIGLTPAEIDELQLMILNFLSKASIQASTGPAISILGNDIGKVGIGEAQIGITLALTLLNRLRSALDGGVIKENITAWVKGNERLSSFSKGDRDALVGRLTSIVSLAVLQNGLVQASVAVGTPGLVGQVLKIALSDLGVKKPVRAETFNDVLNNSGIAVIIEAKLTNDLIQHGFDTAAATQLISETFGKVLLDTPFSSLSQFTNSLAMQFYQAGVGSLAFSRSLALQASEYLLGVAPQMALNAHPFDYPVTMGLIKPGPLLTEKAMASILSGVDRESIESIYKKTVASLFEGGNIRDQLAYFVNDPLLNDSAKKGPPKIAREILSQFYRELQRQGISSGDAIQVAEQLLVYLIKNKGGQEAFQNTPQVLFAVQSAFEQLFSNFGLDAKTARGLSLDTTVASLSGVGEAGTMSLVGKGESAIGSAVAAKRSLLNAATIGVLGSTGASADVLVSVSDSVAQAALGPVHDSSSFIAAIGRGLQSNDSLGLSPSQATAFATAIAHYPVNNRVLAEMGGGSTVSVLSSAAVDEHLLGTALEGEGVSEALAQKLKEILAPYLSEMSAASRSPDQAFKETLQETLSNVLFVSGSYARDVVEHVDTKKVLNADALSGSIGHSLVDNGHLNDLTEAMAVASVVTKNAMSVKGTLSDSVYFQNSLLSNLETGWGVDKQENNEINMMASPDPVINRDALVDGLRQGLANVGEPAERAERLANIAVDELFSAASENAATRGAVREALMSTMRIDIETADRIAKETTQVDAMKMQAIKGLEQAGFSTAEAEKLGAAAAENLFKIGSGEINLHLTAEILKRKAVEPSYAQEHLLNAIMASSVVAGLVNSSTINVTEIKPLIAEGINMALRRRLAASSEESFRNALRDEILKVTDLIDSRDVEKIVQEIRISDSVRRELLVHEMVRRIDEQVGMDDTAYDQARFIADDIFRNGEAFIGKDEFNNALAIVMERYHVGTPEEIRSIVDAMKVGYVIEGGPPLYTANAARALPQVELREQLTNIIMENFKDVIPVDKARRISEEFILALLGPVTVGKQRVDSRSMVDLLKEQVERLVKNVDSKHYRRIMMNGVLDTMSSSSNVSFDAFLFTELLNANGKKFLTLIQDALLNNIGVEDRSIDKTIDLLI